MIPEKSGTRPYKKRVSPTQEHINRLCEHVSIGGFLWDFKGDPDMPERTTMLRAIKANKEWRRQYRNAQKDHADFYLKEMVEIADKATDRDDSAAAKVKLWARDRYCSVVDPKRFATQRTSNEHTGKGGRSLFEGAKTDEARVEAVIRLGLLDHPKVSARIRELARGRLALMEGSTNGATTNGSTKNGFHAH